MSNEDIEDIGEESIEHTYLTFRVGEEEYAVPVGHVTEIVRLQKSFSVPDVPHYIRGVINLRGKVIPLLDVRSRFGLAQSNYSDRTVVVVLEVDDTATGLVVDGVTEVADIPQESIDVAVPQVPGRPSMVRGMGKRADRVSFILDVPRLLSRDSTV